MGNKAGGKGKKDPTILTDEDIKTLKLNTQYTEEEIQAWHSGFLKDCPSGKLDKKQFLNVYKKFYPEGKADKYCNFVFKAFDTDNNNWIDFTEFLLAVGVSQHGNLEDKLKMAFDIYDQNKDGQINRKDMIKIIEAMYDLANEEDRSGDKSPDKRVDLILQRLSKDKSDVVLRNEFVQGCLRDEFLRKILAPNTALLPGGQISNTTTTTNASLNTTTSFNETGAAV
ncbi:unnamed protein product [Adineta steineri]|uniref:EF-hand domain-containing protein n=1 Tax=Adineta steineri TaxID=433720 RepID=A0A815UQN6_9BILA|nr:unnamed protein product [Adineta steineri]CAF1241638.1 unnamed protein product [Adineta steineri]CAF1261460.1 unnamed protein product [Adineta steineri]CAF1517254.1 unnamed protein product [Adineta steineri]CAF1518133.1 unnamed protein product [Adineta steineri]